jgi:hypothetical protein
MLETIPPGVLGGLLLDVGSGDGAIGSNTNTLEERGRTGASRDPFPKHPQALKCRK